MIGQADTIMPDTPASQLEVLAPVDGMPQAALVASLFPFYKQYVIVSVEMWHQSQQSHVYT
jgi:hypothetical protein